MSTRAQIVIKDEFGELWFYRHYDGYPEGTMPTLEKFMGYVKKGKIRDNVEQAAGWLILIGAQEYNTVTTWNKDGGAQSRKKTIDELFNPSSDGYAGWKCGAYEPCSCRAPHGDIEFLYTIDLNKKTIKCKKV